MKKVIGIDLGGTKVSGGIVDENGRILKSITAETQSANGKKGVLDGIIEIIKELIQYGKIEGIGLGTPGFIDTEKGQVLFHSGNIPGWTGVNIKQELSNVFKGMPIFVENDANVAAICEGWIGAGKKLDSFVMITIGTGIGSGIWTKRDGIWHGSNYRGAELGHSILYPNGKPCGCGQKGCAEQYISGRAIEKSYTEKTGKFLKGQTIFKNSKDLICEEVVEKFTQDLAIFLVSIKNIVDPQGLIIGGGVINSKEYWWDKMVDYYRSLSNNLEGMEILTAKYLNKSGMIGAAKIVFDNM